MVQPNILRLEHTRESMGSQMAERQSSYLKRHFCHSLIQQKVHDIPPFFFLYLPFIIFFERTKVVAEGEGVRES